MDPNHNENINKTLNSLLPIQALQGHRWFIWTIVFIIASLGGLATYVWLAAEQDKNNVPIVSQCRSVSLASIGKAVAGQYKVSNGRSVSSIAMPYVEEYAAMNNIDLKRVGDAIFPKGLPRVSRDTGPEVFISSYQHVNRNNGSWTYIKSNTVLIYELLLVRAEDSADPMFLVLYSTAPPHEVIIDRFEAEWRLALLGSDYALLAQRPFKTVIKHREEGLWDMISTDLNIDAGRPVVKVMYTHTGGGGGRDQEFTFHFDAGRENTCFTLREEKQTIDLYDQQ